MAAKLPKSIKVGNRKVDVNIVDYDSPSYKFNDDKFSIEINSDMSDELQVVRFYDGVVQAVHDYINLLEDIAKEVGTSEDVPDFKRENFGAVLKQVIETNKLD